LHEVLKCRGNAARRGGTGTGRVAAELPLLDAAAVAVELAAVLAVVEEVAPIEASASKTAAMRPPGGGGGVEPDPSVLEVPECSLRIGPVAIIWSTRRTRVWKVRCCSLN